MFLCVGEGSCVILLESGVLPEAALNVIHGMMLLCVRQLYWPHLEADPR